MRRALFAVLVVGLGIGAWWALRPAPAPAPPVERPARNAEAPRPGPPRDQAAPAPVPPPAPKPGPQAPVAASEPPITELEREDLIRDALEAALTEGLGRDPSPAELDAMTDALMRMREAQAELRALEGRPSEGGARKRHTDAVAQALADFETHAGVPLDEVTSKTGSGLSQGAPAGEVDIYPLETENP